jgi:predicted phosphate transport protein (TIGR00153 family)
MVLPFLPHSAPFFDLLRAASDEAKSAARALADLCEHFEDVERKVEDLRRIERQADDATHNIHTALQHAFQPPISTQHIRELGSRLDDFVDLIEAAGKRLLLYRMEEATDEARGFARIILQQADLLAEAIPLLEHERDRDKARGYTVDINRLEEDADDVLGNALAGLYEGVVEIPDFVRQYRWGEIYQYLEAATDRAEDVANAIENIVLQHGS